MGVFFREVFLCPDPPFSLSANSCHTIEAKQKPQHKTPQTKPASEKHKSQIKVSNQCQILILKNEPSPPSLRNFLIAPSFLKG